MMSDIGQKVMDTLGIGETTPVRTNEDNNLKEDEMQQPAELAANKDNTKGGDGEDAEGSSARGAKGKEYMRANPTDDEESNYEEDDEEPDIEDKLEDLIGESNMSNMETPCRRPGDLVMVVPCTEHVVDLRGNTGFFIMDLSIIAKMT